MDGFFNSLYTQFLLRDLVAKVVPGFVTFAAIAGLFWRSVEPFLDKLSGIHVLVTLGTLYGISFMVGLFLQFVGQSLKIIVVHVWEKKGEIGPRERSLKKAQEFLLENREDEIARSALFRQRERFAILKETAGNFGMALLALSLGILARILVYPKGHALAWLTAFFILIGVAAILFRQNRYHGQEQRIWEGSIVGED